MKRLLKQSSENECASNVSPINIFFDSLERNIHFLIGEQRRSESEYFLWL